MVGDPCLSPRQCWPSFLRKLLPEISRRLPRSNHWNVSIYCTFFSQLPPTHLCQHLGSFIILEIKAMRRREWGKEKGRRVEAGDSAPQSGKLNNPCKIFSLELAVRCIEKDKSMADADGTSCSRKAKIRCGLALDTDGTWKASQRFPHLQHILERIYMSKDRKL